MAQSPGVASPRATLGQPFRAARNHNVVAAFAPAQTTGADATPLGLRPKCQRLAGLEELDEIVLIGSGERSADFVRGVEALVAFGSVAAQGVSSGGARRPWPRA